jgi:hypothetical protein
MPELHPGITGRKPTAPASSADALCISRATVWRRIKDGTLERVGTGKITKKSIERFAAPAEVKP